MTDSDPLGFAMEDQTAPVIKRGIPSEYLCTGKPQLGAHWYHILGIPITAALMSPLPLQEEILRAGKLPSCINGRTVSVDIS